MRSVCGVRLPAASAVVVSRVSLSKILCARHLTDTDMPISAVQQHCVTWGWHITCHPDSQACLKGFVAFTRAKVVSVWM
jgi:hypothetical protein